MITQSLLFIQFQFLLAFFECSSTRVLQQLALILILTTKGPGFPQLKFLPTNLKVQAEKFSVFALKDAMSGPYPTFLCNNILGPELIFILL